MNRHSVVPAYLCACLLLGGASAAGYVANLLLQLAALPLIGWALWTLARERSTLAIRTPLLLLALLVAIMLIQLVPLPPAIWTSLPGRGPVVEGYRLLGLPLPWLALSLTPDDTLASLLWLLPAFAVFLATAVLGAFRGRWVAGVIVGVVILSVAVGALQVIGGDGGAAYFYQITNWGQAVGFFANSNHNATLLLVAIPFLAALQSALLKRSGSPRSVSAIRLLVAAGFVIIAVGLLINSSLAGIGLGVPVALICLLVFGRYRPTIRRALAVGTILLSAAAVATIAIGPFDNNLVGEQRDNAELSRQTSFALTWRAALDHLPFGSGVGSFQPVYRTQEPLASVGTTYMNHAHSDWLELLLETGLVGIGLAALFLVWWLVRVREIWRDEQRDAFALAAVIATGAMMLHSVVDYPLRTAALSAVFAFCVALIAGVRPYARRSRDAAPSARHLTL